MSLLVELYVQGHIPEMIIKMCIETLLEELNDQRSEILCQMLEKICAYVVKRAVVESQQNAVKEGGVEQRKKKQLKDCIINLEFIEDILGKLFPYRQSPLLSSRVRFKIQDLIDLYQKEWKAVIYGERKVVDDEGFEYKYVPKQQIAIEKVNLPEPNKKGNRSRKVSDASSGPKGMIYVRKLSTQEQE